MTNYCASITINIDVGAFRTISFYQLGSLTSVKECCPFSATTAEDTKIFLFSIFNLTKVPFSFLLWVKRCLP
jgi:hypothetical protein